MRQRGFTLIESIVAMALMTIGVGGLLVALAQSAGHVDFARDNDHAVRLAQRVMHGLRHASDLRSETLEGQEGRFAWRVEVREPEDEALRIAENEKSALNSRVEIFEVDVTVQWSEVEGGPLGHHVRLVSYRAANPGRRSDQISPFGLPVGGNPFEEALPTDNPFQQGGN